MRLRHVAVLVVLFFFVFCGPVMATGTGEEEAEKVQITVGHSYTNAEQAATGIAARTMIDRFKERHPEIDVVEEVIGHDSYQQRIVVLAAGNELPDVFRVKGQMVSDFRAGDRLLRLNDLINGSSDWLAQRKPDSWAAFEVGGGIWGVVPNISTSHLLFYNEDILAESGVDEFPETWDEFLEMLPKIRDAGYIPISMGNQAGWPGQSCWLSAIAGRYTGRDWFFEIYNQEGDAAFTDQPFVDALSAFVDIREANALNDDFPSIDTGASRGLYLNGRAAMIIEGSWLVSEIVINAPEDVLGATQVTVLPQFGDAPTFSSSGGSGWAWSMNANLGERPAERDAAWEFVKALTGSELSSILASYGDVGAAYPSETDSSSLHRLQRDYLELVDSFEKVTQVYDAYLDARLIEPLQIGITEILLGRVDPEQLAKELQAIYENM